MATRQFQNRRRRRMKKSIIALSIVVGILFLAEMCLVETVPPRSLTATRMHMVKRRILRYAREHNRLPPDLSVLPQIEGYDNSIHDAWGNTLIYEVDAEGMVTLKSFGKDGIAGGTGNDKDIVRSFPSRDSKGQWSDELVDWTFDSFRYPSNGHYSLAR